MNWALAGLSPEEYRFTLGVLWVLSLVSLYYFARNWKRLRIIEDTPTAKLRSAHQGYVELTGKGQLPDGQPVYAPLSNHPCLWYRSQIEEQETFTGKGRNTRWNVVYQAVSDHRFKLVDGAASCMVDPSDAEVKGFEQLVWYGNTEWPGRTQILESQSIVHAMANTYRYTECLILPGQPLYVLGQFSTVSATAQRPVREIMIRLINDWKQNQQQLRNRFDTNRDGRIDQDEWEVARLKAQSEAQHIHQQLALQPDEHIIAKPDHINRPFIISIYPQAVLAGQYRSNALAALAAAILLAGYAIWLMHLHG